MPIRREPLERYLKRPTRRNLALVVRHYQRFVWETAFRITGNEEDAEDICQDVFLKLLLHPPAPGRVTSPRGFLAWSAVGRAGRLERAEARRRRREEERLRELAAEDAGFDAEDIETLCAAIGGLPDHLREPLQMRYLAGLSTCEIASLTGVSERTVQRRLEDAREKLKGRLAPLLVALLSSRGLWALPAPPPRAGLLPDLLRAAGMGRALAPAAAAGAPPLAAASTVASGTFHGTLATTTLGGLIMGGKKLFVAGTIALSITLACGGALLLTEHLGSRQPSGGSERIAGGRDAAVAASPLRPTELLDGTGVVEDSRRTAVLEESARRAPPSLHGRIVDAAGGGIADATVWALEAESWDAVASKEREELRGYSRDDPSRVLARVRDAYLEAAGRLPSTRSAAGGRYSFHGLDPSEYRIVVLHPAFVPSRDTVVRTARDRAVEADVVLRPGHEIAGLVLDEDGAPVAGAAVRAERADLSDLKGPERVEAILASWEGGSVLFDPPQVETQAGGTFRLTSLEPSLYDVHAVPRGHLETSAWEVPAGTQDLRLNVSRGAAVAGRVIAPSGEPVADAGVSLDPVKRTEVHELFDSRLVRAAAFAPPAPSGATDADGRFRIAGLAPGSYDLSFDAAGHPPMAREVELAGGELDLGDIQLEPSGAIAGSVHAPDGTPLEGARVWVPRIERSVRPGNVLGGPELAALRETSSGPDGAFLLEDLPHGELELRSSHPDFAGAVLSGIAAPGTGVRIRLAEGLSLRGRVADEESAAPVEGARVEIGFAERRAVVTGADGRFELRGISRDELHRGNAYLRVSHPEYAPHHQDVSVVSWREREVMLRLSRARLLSGRVVDAGGRSIEGAAVWLEARGLSADAGGYDPVRSLRARTGAGGTFSFPAPESVRNMIGDVQVDAVAAHPSYAPRRVGPLAFPRIGDPWPELAIELRPGGTVEGRITDASGAPVEGALVIVREESAARARAESTRTARSGAGGRYRVSGIPDGPWELEVSALGYAPKRLAGLRSGAEPLEIDVALEDGWSIQGRVTDTEGHALAGAEVHAFPAGDLPDAETESSEEFWRRMRLRVERGLARAHTGEDGRFEVRHLPPGTYALLARADGYEAATSPPVDAAGTAEDIVLARFSALEGVVLSAETRGPVERFELEVIDTRARERLRGSGGLFHYRAGSQGRLEFLDRAGRFFYDGVRAGEYEVLIIAEGFVPGRQDLRIEPGEVERIEVLLEPGFIVEGVVVEEETARPIPEAGVMFVYDPGPAGRNRTSPITSRGAEHLLSGPDGVFRAEGLAAGRYRFLAAHPYYIAEPSSEWIELPGEETRAELRMRPAGRLEGRIEGIEQKNEDGLRLGYRLVLHPLSGDDENAPAGKRPVGWPMVPSPLDTISIDPFGGFHKDSLRPGTYRLELKKQAYREGRTVSIGPMGGFSSRDPAGPEATEILGEVEIQPGETTVFEGRAR